MPARRVYTASGVAHFYCPELAKILDDAHHTDAAWNSKLAERDGKGHRSFTFVWDKGDYSILDKANGGIPVCSCGKELTLVRGSNAFTGLEDEKAED